MTPSQRDRARREVAALRRRTANVKRRELVALAETVGRRFTKRGHEPTFEKEGRPPLTIPGHEGNMKSERTVKLILNLIEADIDEDEEANDGLY